jgi:hypothetical protein
MATRPARPWRTPDVAFLVLLFSAAAAVAYGYYRRTDEPFFRPRVTLHREIIDGTAESPYRYRVLVPFAGQALTRALSTVLTPADSFLWAYGIYDLLAVFSLLVMLFVWAKTWFTPEHSLIGVLFVAATMPLALQDHYFQPWSLAEAALFCAGLLAIQRRRPALLFAVVALASLNRETAIFLPLAFLLTVEAGDLRRADGARNWKPLLLFAGLLLTWATIYGGLRLWRGEATHIETIEGLWARNTERQNLIYALENAGLFLGGFWIFAALGLPRAPTFLKRVAWIIPVYLATILVWGVWYEVRLLMPLYAILLPLGLFFLFPPRATAAI